MPRLPTGTVTFLMTDIEGSIRLWEADEEAMRVALARHDQIVGEAVERHDGYLIKTRGEGDSLFSVFSLAPDAVAAAVAAQRRLSAEPWPEAIPVRVRMAIHTGHAEVHGNDDYYGPAVNRCARLRAVGHGGQVLLSAATTALVRDVLPADVTLDDLGDHRLRDLARPERIAQVGHPELPDQFPPLAALDRARHNLPVQLSTFVGRERELSAVRDLLDQRRFVTMTGVGGAGKTRIALQVAAEALDHFPGGVWFVPLDSLEEAGSVWHAVAEAARVPVPPTADVGDVLVDEFADSAVLVLLDSCEHSLAACSSLVRTLLSRCAGVKVLATSREALGVYGESVFAVQPLASPPPGDTTPEALGQYDAVRLFLDRVALVRRGFAVTNENAPAIAQICYRLDGIPLAIELAAARVRLLSPDQIAQRLDDSFGLLVAGSRTALPRHQTLRSMLDWSHDTLSEAERTLFRRLAVFPSGWSIEGAEAVCADAQLPVSIVLDQLSHLIDRSLLHVEEPLSALTRSTDSELWLPSLRYRMLDTVRRYALERLAATDETEALLDRLLDFGLTVVPDEEPRPDEVSARVELEETNIRHALTWGLAARDERAFRLALRLSRAWWLQERRVREGREWLRQASAAAPPEFAVELLIAEAWLARTGSTGDLTIARECLDEARVRLGPDGDPRLRAIACTRLGDVLWAQGREREALPLLEEARTVAIGAGDERVLMRALVQLARTRRHLGDIEGARSAFEEALVVGRPLERLVATVELAVACRELGDSAGAGRHLDEARRIVPELPERDRLTGQTTLALAEPVEAQISMYEDALIESRRGGVRYPFPVFWNLVSVLTAVDRLDRARELVDGCVTDMRASEDAADLVHALVAAAGVALRQDDVDAALECAREAMRTATGSEEPVEVASANATLADALLCAGQGAGALPLYEAAIADRRARGWQRSALRSLAGAAAAQLGSDLDAAAEQIGEAIDLLGRMTVDHKAASVLAAAAALAARRGRFGDAAALAATASSLAGPVDSGDAVVRFLLRDARQTAAGVLGEPGARSQFDAAEPLPLDRALSVAQDGIG